MGIPPHGHINHAHSHNVRLVSPSFIKEGETKTQKDRKTNRKTEREIKRHKYKQKDRPTRFQQIGPLLMIFGANWAPAYRAPADWAQWKMLVWQIGPLENADAAKYATEVIAPKVTKQLYN